MPVSGSNMVATPQNEKGLHECNPLIKLARPERFELPTPWFVAKYSIQMSYGRVEEAALYGSLPFLPS